MTCLNGYSKTGSLTCKGTGDNTVAWDYFAVNCIAASCSSIVSTLTATQHLNASRLGSACSIGMTGDTCTYECDSGYSKGGSVTCDGTNPGVSSWSNGASCQPITCSSFDLNSISHANTSTGSTCNTLKTGAECTSMTCLNGYTKNGALTCKGTGDGTVAWDYQAVTCTPTSCGSIASTLSSVQNIDISRFGTKCSNGMTGDECTYECQHGYSKVGTVTCDGTNPGTSAWSNHASCQPITCSSFDLTSIAHANTSTGSGCNALKTGDTCTAMECNKEIGRAVQQECRDRSRMPSSA
eukprot:TRINITY_DN10013_c0_g1_i6.p1 TRINITY_DN10013_c0_g1~~TRINITY_DN10013_c0_g1_i6.p1  ORF type:complete len:307 (-),score=22.15 TRINITY_DN10013_c0_g1_i6:20-907(-)